jgi:signal transduction histidine kinase/ligand-binding sensor domain-containing protein
LSASAAQAQYRIDRWTTNEGLPQNSVTSLMQTRDGYLWMTTNDGLVRFDGVRFTVFNRNNSPEFPTNRLSSLFEDQSGRLWFHTEGSAVLFYEKGRFTLALKPNEIPPAPLSAFHHDGAGGVLFHSGGQNYRWQAGKFVPFQLPGLPAGSLIILTDRDGGFWFTDKGCVHLVKDGQVKTYQVAQQGKATTYHAAYQDRNGGIWLFLSQTTDEPLVRIKNEQVQRYPFPGSNSWQFIEDLAGNLWFTVYNQGVYRIDASTVAASEPLPNAIRQVVAIPGISSNTSGQLCPDREGGMWLGTEQGLLRLQPQTIRYFNKQDGLPSENVYPLYEDQAGNVWAGIWQNSLVKYAGGRFATVRQAVETYFITTLFEDRQGRLWYGALGKLFYLENGKPVLAGAQVGFPQYTEFSVIVEDKAGNLWFGTSNGLSRYADGRATVFTKHDGLPDNYVIALLPTKDGKMLIGTRGGLGVLENGMLHALTEKDGLGSNYIRSLYEDADGVVWIGSYDGGLTRYRDGRFTRYSTQNGLYSNGVFCILEDSQGWFWMNSNQGLHRVRRQELNDFAAGRTRYLTSIGYNKIEGNGGRQPAGIKTRDGRLWFPTGQGITVVDPATVKTNLLPPPVLIEDISIEREPVGNNLFQSAIRNPQSAIVLSPAQHNLELRYTGLSYLDSEQVKFRYKLEGLESAWNEVGTRRSAYYSYLPPGQYTFRVSAANRDGVWNPTGATVRIIVQPPFYRTWWFMTACLLGGSALIVGGVRYRVRQLQARAAAQEAFSRQLIASQENERGRIAAELHDGLSQSLVIIKNRAMLSLIEPADHDRALEQLREIADASTHAIDEVKEIIYDLRPIQLDRLGLTRSIEDVLDNVTGAHGLELSKQLDDVDGVFTKEFENSLYRIVQESLNNIIKHAAATHIEVRLRKHAQQVELLIRDNGKGFVPGASQQHPTRKGGFGLVGMVERAKLLGGHTRIESTPGSGTTVSVIVPLGLKG